jgi:hypothetical protein
MFIADGPRQDSSPQRGDMCIAVALDAQIFTSDVAEFKGLLKPTLSQINWPKHVTPLG